MLAKQEEAKQETIALLNQPKGAKVGNKNQKSNGTNLDKMKRKKEKEIRSLKQKIRIANKDLTTSSFRFMIIISLANMVSVPVFM